MVVFPSTLVSSSTYNWLKSHIRLNMAESVDNQISGIPVPACTQTEIEDGILKILMCAIVLLLVHVLYWISGERVDSIHARPTMCNTSAGLLPDRYINIT